MDKTVIVHDPESDDEPCTDEVKDEGCEDFTVYNDHWVTDRFTISTFLGRGKFGEVKKCTHVDSGEAYAAKFISTPTVQEKRDVEHEISIMRKLRHHLVLQLFSAYTSKTEMCLILELVSGGELFERIIDDDFILTERACVSFMRQTCRAMEYIHSRNIVHLDMKPENILCLTRLGTRIKVIDFGLAREVERGKELRVMFGTPEFMAPEVVNYELVDYATDMWSIGVICYVLLSGLSPFMGKNDAETLTNVIKAAYSFRYDDFQDISDDAKDLISNLLQKDRRKRLSATQCLQHRWLRRSPEDVSPTLHQSKKRLKRFVIRRKWQKVFNAIIALKRMGVSPASLMLNPPTLTNGVHGDQPAQHLPQQRHQQIVSEDKSSRHTPLSYKKRRMKKGGGAKDSSSGGSSSSHSRSAYTGEDQSSSGSSASESTTSAVSTPQSSHADMHKSPAAPTSVTATSTAAPGPAPAIAPIAGPTPVLTSTPGGKVAAKQEQPVAAAQPALVLPAQKLGKGKVASSCTADSQAEKDSTDAKADSCVAKTQPDVVSVTLPRSNLAAKPAKFDKLGPAKQVTTNTKVADSYKSQLKPVGRKGVNGMSTLPLHRSADTGSCSKQADTPATAGKSKDGKMTVRDNNWLSSKTNFIRLKFKETFL